MDNINHVISNDDIEELQKITKDMHDLIVRLYREKILKVNEDKNQVLQSKRILRRHLTIHEKL